jgi:DNA-binding MarR family transcriptional regulator
VVSLRRQDLDDIKVCQDVDVSQVDVSTSIGYSLKRVTWALRAAMDAELRTFDLSVSQYASLELLVQRPGISNADLARGVFVSRQATHQLLAGLRAAGLVEVTGGGRDQRLTVTPVGAAKLTHASRAIAAIERRMLGGLSSEDQDALRASLDSCVQALTAAETVD